MKRKTLLDDSVECVRDNRERKIREWYDANGRLLRWTVAEALPTHNPDEPEFGHYPDAKQKI
jgi:ABC-type phosphate transport system auxiliary subunit